MVNATYGSSSLSSFTIVGPSHGNWWAKWLCVYALLRVFFFCLNNNILNDHYTQWSECPCDERRYAPIYLSVWYHTSRQTIRCWHRIFFFSFHILAASCLFQHQSNISYNCVKIKLFRFFVFHCTGTGIHTHTVHAGIHISKPFFTWHMNRNLWHILMSWWRSCLISIILFLAYLFFTYPPFGIIIQPYDLKVNVRGAAMRHRVILYLFFSALVDGHLC